jgi:ATP-dependent exoDNAse (exonuclease V) alpha subunit
VAAGPAHRRGERIDQVRNGNRWRVAGVDAKTGRLAAERLTDSARVVFEGEYLREHITLGYAVTLHSAQGITVGSAERRGACFTVLSEKATRAMAYVGMTRGKDENHAYIYQPLTGESDHEHGQLAAGEQIHQMRRGNKHAAAHYFRLILANNDRPRTMHAEAERTDRDLLPDVVVNLLGRNDQRRASRLQAWRQYSAADRARAAAYQRLTASRRDTTAQTRSRGRSQDYGLEL